MKAKLTKREALRWIKLSIKADEEQFKRMLEVIPAIQERRKAKMEETRIKLIREDLIECKNKLQTVHLLIQAVHLAINHADRLVRREQRDKEEIK